MFTTKDQIRGGQITAKISREKALKKYYENPNKCLKCDAIIVIPDNKKVSQIKHKKFCTSSCAAKYNNVLYPKKIKTIKVKIPRLKKPKIERVKIIKEKVSLKRTLEGLNKGEFFKKASNWQSARSSIQRHARRTYNESDKPKQCKVCEYKLHYQVCHVKSVSSFPDEADIVNEINHIENLMALCPNHHWEYDEGILIIQ